MNRAIFAAVPALALSAACGRVAPMDEASRQATAGPEEQALARVARSGGFLDLALEAALANAALSHATAKADGACAPLTVPLDGRYGANDVTVTVRVERDASSCTTTSPKGHASVAIHDGHGVATVELAFSCEAALEGEADCIAEELQLVVVETAQRDVVLQPSFDPERVVIGRECLDQRFGEDAPFVCVGT